MNESNSMYTPYETFTGPPSSAGVDFLNQYQQYSDPYQSPHSLEREKINISEALKIISDIYHIIDTTENLADDHIDALLQQCSEVIGFIKQDHYIQPQSMFDSIASSWHLSSMQESSSENQ
jgi:hypothetical protein